VKFDISSIDFKDRKTRLAILMGLVSVLAAVIYVSFVLIPQVERVSDAVRQAAKVSAELKDAGADIADIPKLKDAMVSYEEKVNLYEKMLPAEQEIPTLLEGLSEMAKSSGVKIGGIMPVATKEDRTKKADIYREQPILINAKCGFHELGRFLSRMENADRFMKVADINIKSTAQSPKKHEVELLVLTYTLSRGR
jgi:type IV pilus assembly protein PilO